MNFRIFINRLKFGHFLRLALMALGLSYITLAQAQFKACGGSNNWPPMSYQLPGQAVQGISADLLRSLLPQIQFELRPWQRCLNEVAGLAGFDLAMSVARTPERERLFYFSKPYHQLTPSYLYLKQRFPSPPVTKLADLQKYRVCALHGANSAYTGLSPEKIESGATTYLSLQRKLERGHCDLVVEMREVLYGFAELELLPFRSQDYQIQNLPEVQAYPLHFAISRHHSQAGQILELLNKGIAEQQRHGGLNKLILRYQAGQ